MSSSPSWKKFFAEGIERFRLQDLDGALNSFDKVLTFPSLFISIKNFSPRDSAGYPYRK